MAHFAHLSHSYYQVHCSFDCLASLFGKVISFADCLAHHSFSLHLANFHIYFYCHHHFCTRHSCNHHCSHSHMDLLHLFDSQLDRYFYHITILVQLFHLHSSYIYLYIWDLYYYFIHEIHTYFAFDHCTQDLIFLFHRSDLNLLAFVCLTLLVELSNMADADCSLSLQFVMFPVYCQLVNDAPNLLLGIVNQTYNLNFHLVNNYQ